MACPGRLNPQDIGTIARHLNYSNWLMLSYLASNMDPSVFRILFADIASEIRTRNASSCSILDGEEKENSANETLEERVDNILLMPKVDKQE